MSRYDLANAMGVRYPYVANIENGQRPLPHTHWDAVASALRVPPETFGEMVQAAEDDRRAEPNAPQRLPGAIQSLVEAISPDLQQWQILELAAAQERAQVSDTTSGNRRQQSQEPLTDTGALGLQREQFSSERVAKSADATVARKRLAEILTALTDDQVLAVLASTDRLLGNDTRGGPDRAE